MRDEIGKWNIRRGILAYATKLKQDLSQTDKRAAHQNIGASHSSHAKAKIAAATLTEPPALDIVQNPPLF